MGSIKPFCLPLHYIDEQSSRRWTIGVSGQLGRS
uniref:Uncharacterized protein n=1 Tax=Arundo donax TaxID=35708 RepID=A0A0A8ZDP5_ARUDO